MNGSLDITNARIVLPETGVVPGTLAIRDGRVSAILQDAGPTGDAEVLDAEGRHVLPGFIDPHVHSGLLPPLGERLEAESAFALSGGITTIIRYFRRPESYLDTLPAQIALGEQRHYQDFAHHLVLFDSVQVGEMERYVREFGVTSFKLYMNLKGALGKGVLMDLLVDQPDELTTADVDFTDGHLWNVFRTAARLPAQVRLNVHSEDAEIVLHESARVRELGLEGLPAWSAARPGDSEALARISARARPSKPSSTCAGKGPTTEPRCVRSTWRSRPRARPGLWPRSCRRSGPPRTCPASGGPSQKAC
jgi:dihydropyrimidinase